MQSSIHVHIVDVSMFECKLCVDRTQTEIPRIVVLTFAPPTGSAINVSVLVERVGQFWREAAVDS